MKKRGQLLLKFGVDLLVGAIIVATFLGVSYKYGTGEVILKIRTAKDVGLMIEEMYLIPNEINTYIEYPEDTSKLDINIKGDAVTVSSGTNDILTGVYNFVSSANYPYINKIIEKPKKLYVGKINGNIIITDKKPDLRKLQCSELKSKLIINKVLIDSGLDDDNIEKAKISNSIAFSLISKLNEDYQVEHTRNDDMYDLIKTPLRLIKTNLNQKIEQSDLIIKIQIAEKQDNSNNIKIYFSPDSEKREQISNLACNILNNLIEDEALNEITGIAVIPKETEPILDNNKLSMIIEIGNYLNENSLDMLKDVSTIETITSTIYNTIK